MRNPWKCLLPVLTLLALVACSAPPPTATPRPPSPSATAMPAHIATATAPVATSTAAPGDTPPPTATEPAPPTATLPLPTPTWPPATATPAPSPTPPERVDPVVTSLVVTPDDPPLLYAVVEARLYRSADRGANWSEESYAGLPAGARFHGVAIDYRHPETMYGLTDQGIYRREGAGAWALVNTLHALALAVDLQDPNVLWAGIYHTSEMNAVIVKSNDRGRTWGKADEGIPPSSWASDILVDPNNPNILWAVVRSGGHRGWPPGDLYRGGRAGQWERLDLGQFEPAFGNVDSCFVAGIAYDPNANLLFAGCDLSYFNEGNLFLLRSDNANAVDSSTVRWEVATRFPAEAPERVGAARPLAVDAREPRSLFLSTAIQEWGQPNRYRILVSHNHGATWEPLEMRGLPGLAGD
jgi:hypothetical protein